MSEAEVYHVCFRFCEETLPVEELKAIADALEVAFEQSSTLPDVMKFKIEN